MKKTHEFRRFIIMNKVLKLMGVTLMIMMMAPFVAIAGQQYEDTCKESRLLYPPISSQRDVEILSATYFSQFDSIQVCAQLCDIFCADNTKYRFHFDYDADNGIASYLSSSARDPGSCGISLIGNNTGTTSDDTVSFVCESDNPSLQSNQASVMISPETLNKWIIKGIKNLKGFTKLVVLDVTSQSRYVEGHVPGAFLFDSAADLAATRSDGVSETIAQVATKAQMDDLIQRTGIDENTVIVFTTDGGSASNLMQLGRAYYNFRYWGFPKNRLKVLDGNNATYEAAGFPLEKAVPPVPEPTTYSVCQLTQNTTVRAPFGEMVAVSEDNDPDTIVIDARSPDEYNGVPGKTSGPTGASGGYVAFEGHVRTAVHQNYTELVTPDFTLLPKEDLRAIFAAIGVYGTETTYEYCRTSWRAAITFLALDGVLGYPTKIYDGAWIEWGQMATSSKSGALTNDSPWRTDNASRSESITYNQDAGLTVYQITDANSYSTQATAVNTTDSAICGTDPSEGRATSKRVTGPATMCTDVNENGNFCCMVPITGLVHEDGTVISECEYIDIWMDTQYKGITDRIPDTYDEDGCSKPTGPEEVLQFIADGTPPVFYDCPTDETVECGSIPSTAAVTAVDNCDTSPDIQFSETSTAESGLVVETITRTWVATDDANNSSSCIQTITVIDTTPPVLSGCPADMPAECDNVPNPAAVAAADSCDSSPGLQFSQTTVSGDCPQEETLVRVWTATDASGNSASCSQTLQVQDTVPPVIQCPDDIEIVGTTPIGVEWTLIPPADNCAQNLTVTCTPSSGSTFPIGSTQVDCTAVDDCGNSSLCSFMIEVKGAISPTNVFLDSILPDNNYTFFNGSTSSDGTKMLVTVNKSTGPMTGPNGTSDLYILDAHELEQTNVVQIGSAGQISGDGSGPFGATISFRSSWNPDGSKIAIAGADRLFIVDAITLQPLNGINGDTNIGGQNHDAMFTSDGKYVIMTLRTKPYSGGNASKMDGEIQLYDVSSGQAVGSSISVCNACHGQSTPRNSALSGLDGTLTKSNGIYTGTVFVAGHGGHFAKAQLSIDPSNTANPITVTNLSTVGVSIVKFAEGDSQYKLHDSRLDGNTLYWSTYNVDANNQLHYGKVDLATGEVSDVAIDVPSEVTIPPVKPNMMPNYSASGQTTEYFMPISMAHSGYITVIPKNTITGKVTPPPVIPHDPSPPPPPPLLGIAEATNVSVAEMITILSVAPEMRIKDD